MKKIHVVTETYHDGFIRVVRAFDDADKAALFCLTMNGNSHHTFFIDEIELEEKGEL